MHCRHTSLLMTLCASIFSLIATRQLNPSPRHPLLNVDVCLGDLMSHWYKDVEKGMDNSVLWRNPWCYKMVSQVWIGHSVGTLDQRRWRGNGNFWSEFKGTKGNFSIFDSCLPHFCPSIWFCDRIKACVVCCSDLTCSACSCPERDHLRQTTSNCFWITRALWSVIDAGLIGVFFLCFEYPNAQLFFKCALFHVVMIFKKKKKKIISLNNRGKGRASAARHWRG